MKTTTTKDVEIKSKRIAKENEKIGEINNSINNNNNINGSNNLNKILIKEDEKDIVKVEEDNIINNKVDSRCCMM